MVPDLQLALDAAHVADAVTLPFFRRSSLVVETKADESPVTDADRGAEAAIRELLARERPGDGVLGEEMGITGGSERRWFIDPIDGTRNFVRGVPVWGTLIGLEIGGSMQIGVVSAPALGRRWWAKRGEGAYARTGDGLVQRISVSERKSLSEAGVSSGSISHFPDPLRALELFNRAREGRGFGDFWQHMLVAEGAIEVALDPIVSVWDVAPLQVIVEEAGGRFTDFSGERRLDGGSAISTNAIFHDTVVSILSGTENG
ncbi:MAG TPA: inositol monophosphatase family protein [Acidimicrobiales bacterium]|nr:inositol monophosphatase family protein [Acidimicrobiales bacterium]